MHFDRPAEQVIVNEYQPGQGIAHHADRGCFGPAVATLSLLDTWPMSFERSGDEPIELWLPPGMLIILTGEALVVAPWNTPSQERWGTWRR